jgi:hypothetical protein
MEETAYEQSYYLYHYILLNDKVKEEEYGKQYVACTEKMNTEF